MAIRERRRARRRRLPFLRSGVLEVDGRSHIVAVTDLSPEGAFVSTRVAVAGAKALRLKMVLPRDGREVVLPCRLVRRSERFDPASGQPAGLALRFQGLEAAVIRRVEEFAIEGFLPSPDPVPPDHLEYRLLERSEVNIEELNRLGLDGWMLTAALPAGKMLRLVLMRRL